MTSKHPYLEEWLLHNGTKPFYNVSISINTKNDCMTSKALSDLHKMMSQESDDYIASFFIGARSKIKKLLNTEYSGCIETRNWPPETD